MPLSAVPITLCREHGLVTAPVLIRPFPYLTFGIEDIS